MAPTASSVDPNADQPSINQLHTLPLASPTTYTVRPLHQILTGSSNTHQPIRIPHNVSGNSSATSVSEKFSDAFEMPPIHASSDPSLMSQRAEPLPSVPQVLNANGDSVSTQPWDPISGIPRFLTLPVNQGSKRTLTQFMYKHHPDMKIANLTNDTNKELRLSALSLGLANGIASNGSDPPSISASFKSSKSDLQGLRQDYQASLQSSKLNEFEKKSRSANAFILYRQATSKEYRGANVPNGEISKLVAERWKNEDASVIAKFREQARVLRVERKKTLEELGADATPHENKRNRRKRAPSRSELKGNVTSEPRLPRNESISESGLSSQSTSRTQSTASLPGLRSFDLSTYGSSKSLQDFGSSSFYTPRLAVGSINSVSPSRWTSMPSVVPNPTSVVRPSAQMPPPNQFHIPNLNAPIFGSSNDWVPSVSYGEATNNSERPPFIMAQRQDHSAAVNMPSYGYPGSVSGHTSHAANHLGQINFPHLPLQPISPVHFEVPTVSVPSAAALDRNRSSPKDGTTNNAADMYSTANYGINRSRLP